jgi:hypothetical protein
LPVVFDCEEDDLSIIIFIFLILRCSIHDYFCFSYSSFWYVKLLSSIIRMNILKLTIMRILSGVEKS